MVVEVYAECIVLNRRLRLLALAAGSLGTFFDRYVQTFSHIDERSRIGLSSLAGGIVPRRKLGLGTLPCPRVGFVA